MINSSPLWFATRGAGVVLLLLITATVVLGIVTSMRWKSEEWPLFLVAGLHRNLSLLVVIFGALHVVTAVLDPFTALGWTAAVVPFGSSYRPLWLGLGVISAELLIAIVVTSLLRGFLGYGPWKVIHWLTYASWPTAMLHSIGTGSDVHSAWFVLLAGVCGLAVLFALVWRIGSGFEQRPGLRLALQSACIAAAFAAVMWTSTGPLQPGWAAAAGTPPALLSSTAASAQVAQTQTTTQEISG